METEIIIIGILVIFTFIGFEMLSIKAYKKTIKKLENHIAEQDDFIKVLQKDYSFIVQKQFNDIRKKLSENNFKKS